MFSPDGKKVVLRHAQSSGADSLVVIDVKTHRQTVLKLHSFANYFPPVWSPSGAKLLVLSDIIESKGFEPPHRFPLATDADGNIDRAFRNLNLFDIQSGVSQLITLFPAFQLGQFRFGKDANELFFTRSDEIYHFNAKQKKLTRLIRLQKLRIVCSLTYIPGIDRLVFPAARPFDPPEFKLPPLAPNLVVLDPRNGLVKIIAQNFQYVPGNFQFVPVTARLYFQTCNKDLDLADGLISGFISSTDLNGKNRRTICHTFIDYQVT